MNTKARTARRIIKNRTAQNMMISRANRAVASGGTQSAKTRLIDAGITPATANRFAGAFSRGVVADAMTTGKVKYKKNSRITKTVPVKLYTAGTFAARLATYRPNDKAAAAEFAAAA